MASKLGGYNHRTNCANGRWMMTAMNRMACEDGNAASTCDLTVGQIEDCASAMSAAPSGGIPPACTPLLGC